MGAGITKKSKHTPLCRELEALLLRTDVGGRGREWSDPPWTRSDPPWIRYNLGESGAVDFMVLWARSV